MEILTPDKYSEFEEFNLKNPKGHLFQSSLWGEIKKDWKREVVVVRNEDGSIRAGVSVIIRKMPVVPYSLMYAPRGPVCDISDKDALSQLIDGVRALAKKYNCYEFVMDPDVPVTETEFIKTLESLGLVRGTSSDGGIIQPRFVYRLNVEGKTADEVIAGFHSKTRYNMRVALKHGVEVRNCGLDGVDEFSRLMNVTGVRDGFPPRPKAYFETILKVMGDNARLCLAYYEDKPIAGILPARYGDKVWYLYGASDNAYRNVMPNYLLQTEMIRWAIDSKCRIYDFRGVASRKSEEFMEGLYRFKKGFGGDLIEFPGEFRITFHPLANKFINFSMDTVSSLRKIKREMHGSKK